MLVDEMSDQCFSNAIPPKEKQSVIAKTAPIAPMVAESASPTVILIPVIQR